MLPRIPHENRGLPRAALPGIAAPLIEVHDGDAIVRFNPVPRIAHEKNVMPVLMAIEPPACERK